MNDEDDGLNRSEFLEILKQAAQMNAIYQRMYAKGGPVDRLLETGQPDYEAFLSCGCIVTALDDLEMRQ